MVAPVFISTNSVGGFPFLHTLSSIYCLVDSLIGEGNSTPLQYSCLENLMDGGAWWAACSPWGLEKSDTTERLHFHFSLSCIGEGNGNPLQCSCLENPRDGGAWRAAVYGVAQSRTRLKRLSSSSSRFVSYVTFINSNQFLFFMKQWKFPWKHVNNTVWRPYHFSDFTV